MVIPPPFFSISYKITPLQWGRLRFECERYRSSHRLSTRQWSGRWYWKPTHHPQTQQRYSKLVSRTRTNPKVTRNCNFSSSGGSFLTVWFQKVKTLPESPDHETVPHSTSSCSICHLPYNTNNVPIRATVLKCSSCRSGKVPDVLITTIETPDGAPTVGRGCFIQSFVCR